MLTRHDVGHRFAIRVFAGQRGGRRLYSELVGELLEVTGQRCVFRTRSGDRPVELSTVAAARRIPNQRPITATERLELIAAAGWPAPEVGAVGDWLLRACAGWTGRGNSALPVGLPRLPLPAAVDAVAAWYTERGLVPAISVPQPTGARLTAELRSRGWQADPPALVQTATLAEVVRLAGAGAGEIRLAEVPEPAWLELVSRTKGGLPEVALGVITGVPVGRFAGCYDDQGRALAVARGVIAADRSWLGISLVGVDPAVRRQGLATALVHSLASWAGSAGATQAYLQVSQDNEAAVRLYTRLGFSTHHRYTVWRS